MHRLLKFLHLLCQMCGVAPIKPTAGKLWKCLYHSWCLLIILHIYTMCYLQAWQRIDQKQPTVEKALYLSEFITNSMIVTVIMANRYYHMDYFCTLPNEFKGLLAKVQNINGRFDDEIILTIRHLGYLAALIGLFHMCCFAIDLFFWDFHTWRFIRSSGASNLPNVVISMNLLQYWLALKFLNLLYKRINITLDKLVQEQCHVAADATVNSIKLDVFWFKREFDTAANIATTPPELIDKMRDLYSELDMLLKTLISAFGLILMLIFLASFLDLSIQFFAIYKYFDVPQERNELSLAYNIIWVVQHVGRIFIILLTNNGITREKCRTYYIINQLDSRNITTEHAINRFLLHLMVRKPIESACGVFDLDLTFLGGITSAMAMYVIFIIQTDLGNVSMAGGFINSSA